MHLIRRALWNIRVLSISFQCGDDQYKLYYNVDLPCVCRYVSGYGNIAVFYPADQNEVDGACVCGNGAVLFCYGRHRYESGGRRVAFELYYFFLVQQECKTLYTEGKSEKSKI